MTKLKEKPGAKSAKKKYRVVEGIHCHGELIYTKGMILESKLPLDEMHRNKLEVVPNEMPVSKPIHRDDYKLKISGAEATSGVKLKHKRKEVSLDPEYDDEIENEATDDEPEDGQTPPAVQAADVTELFPFVMEEARDLRVLSDGKFYNIAREVYLHEYVNDKPLKKSEVKKFVEYYLAN